MLTVTPTRDEGRIKALVTHPAIWKGIADDSSPRPECWFPDVNGERVWLVVRLDDEAIGLFAAEPRTKVLWVWHVGFLPKCCGDTGRKATKLFFQWIWENTSCVRLIGEVPKCNHLAFWFALRVGMRIFAVNPASFLRNGKLYDLILFGMSRPEPECKP
jgi:hypothetical protein